MPSGDQIAWVTSSSRSVSLRASPPRTGATYSCMAPPSRLDVKASHVPSGDHLGSASRRDPVVNRRGSPDPSTAASQIAAPYSFFSRSTLPTT